MNKISLQYIDALFKIEFEKPFTFFTFPAFVFRSILGSRLRALTCMMPKNKCTECQFNKTCAYATIFETIIEKDTDFLPGRDKGSHPFRIKISEYTKPNTPLLNIDLTIQLYGFAVQYLPYIFYSLKAAGNDGLFKTKSRYKVKDIIVAKNSLLKKDGSINTNFSHTLWEYAPKPHDETTVKHIQLNSPLRFKVQGKYTTDFSSEHFFCCAYRRLVTLCSLYGNYETLEYMPSQNLTIKNNKLFWSDYEYNSRRQDIKIKMGGVSGTFTLEGNLNEYEHNLLNFVNLFGAGKNTNFGFGNINVE